MALPVVIQAVRWTHILAGFTAFFIAPVPLLTAKGGKTHRRWGKIYFWSLAVVALTAMVLALWLPILFLAFIAVFSFYFAFRGYRVLSRKRPLLGEGPGAPDWIAAVLALLGSAALIVLGFLRPSPVWARLGIVAIAFGVIGVASRRVTSGNSRIRPPTKFLVVCAHGRNDRVVHRGGFRIFSGQLSLSAISGALAVAQRYRRAGDFHLDRLLQEKIRPNWKARRG